MFGGPNQPPQNPAGSTKSANTSLMAPSTAAPSSTVTTTTKTVTTTGPAGTLPPGQKPPLPPAKGTSASTGKKKTTTTTTKKTVGRAGVGAKKTAPSLAFTTNFKNACGITPSTKEKTVIPWDHKNKNYVYDSKTIDHVYGGKVNKALLSNQVDGLRGDSSWNPVGKCELCLIICIVWTILVIAAVIVVTLVFLEDIGLKGYWWFIIVVGLIALIFGCILLCCCREYANRQSWKKRCLLNTTLNKIEQTSLAGTDYGLRSGKEGAWIEYGPKAKLDQFKTATVHTEKVVSTTTTTKKEVVQQAPPPPVPPPQPVVQEQTVVTTTTQKEIVHQQPANIEPELNLVPTTTSTQVYKDNMKISEFQKKTESGKIKNPALNSSGLNTPRKQPKTPRELLEESHLPATTPIRESIQVDKP